ncbi:MAG: ABC transporter ATP-binding protein [Methylobacteriaceae bacterium]|nr:ABC transporter ATP-binding protein [Methylobacteriaceae bacterium]
MAMAGDLISDSGNSSAAAAPKLRVDESHCYGDFLVHEGIRFDVRENEFLCVCGPSGCGKTTLLDILSGNMKPTQGSVKLDGHEINPRRDRVSFVFQEPSTLPWLTVRDNVSTGLRIRRTDAAERDRQVDAIIGMVGLKGFEDHYPHQISGGMKQRVAIARAFVIDADLILMDEPFVSLDQPTRERMQREVLDVWERRRRTVIFVTHNIEEAVFLGDRIIVLSTKPARIVADIAIPLDRPRDPLSTDFIALRTQCSEKLHAMQA